MDFKMKGKTAVVIGGTTGIGAATAKRFLEEGCNVAVCSHSEGKVSAFQEETAQAGPERIMAEVVNAVSLPELEAFADRVVKKFGRIDYWINCAGGNKHGPLYSLPEDTFDYIVDLNLKTAFLGMQAASKHMMPQKSGVIINISSLSAYMPVAYRTTYAAAKAGVNMLTVGAAAELAPYGIRVNAIAPGICDTVLSAKAIYEQTDYTMSLIPMHRAGSPQEMGDVIVALCSDNFGYVNGAIWRIDGGKNTMEDNNLAWTNPWDK